jgi:glycosyltransferase involved in cell wall biosynthesis
MTARLALCIPAYNQPGFLREALDSLCDQGLDRGQFVVAISDDASPTPLEPVVEEYTSRLSIAYRRQPANRGHLANWDAAWQLVDTPFVAFLAHDDVLTPGHLGRALAAIDADPAAVLVASLALSQPFPGALKSHAYGILPRGAQQASYSTTYRWECDEWMAMGLVTTPSSIVGSVFRRDAFAKCRAWLDFPLWHDRLMLAEVGLYGRVLTVPWIAGVYRTGDWQLSGRIWQSDMTEFRRATAAVLGWCRERGIDVLKFWVEHICAAADDERVMYLQMVGSAFDDEQFNTLRRECEARLGGPIRIGRLERLGVPAPLVKLMRAVDRRLLGRHA